MSRCPSCSSESAEWAAFCSHCGAPLDSTSLPTMTSLPDDDSAGFSLPRATSSTGVGRFSISRDSLEPARFLPGNVVDGRYRIVGLIGRGGMGEVYRADDLKLQQPVALKFLPLSLNKDPERLSRFLNEVRVARRVSHPNVCRVYDIGEVSPEAGSGPEAGGQHYISMEFIDGEDLATLIRRIGRLPQDKAVEIARQLCAGMTAAHRAGIVHRDLKPANVMIDGDGQVRITDFGLAGVAEAMRGAEIRAGTPGYMAPEQVEGREVTVQSDIYALGHVLYELFTGRVVFQAKTLAEMRELQMGATPDSPSSVVPDLDANIEHVILRCLEKDPVRRPRSAFAVSVALPGNDPLAAALAAGETPSPDMVADAGDSRGLRPWVVIACVATFLAGVLFLFGVSDTVFLHRMLPIDKPPAALVVEAREFLSATGASDPADRAYGVGFDASYLDHVREGENLKNRWDDLASVRPSPALFWYRESPAPLVATRASGDVSYRNPPMRLSGMSHLVLDMQGRLVDYLAIPPQHAPPPGPDGDTGAPTAAAVDPPSAPADPVEPDWSPLFDKAGIDVALLEPATPEWNPLVDCDVRAAWTGTFPDQPDVPIRVEAGAFRGRLIYFELVAPWSSPWRLDPPRATGAARVVNYVLIGLLLLLTAVSLLVVRRNLRLGRGDKRGAFRTAALVFAMIMVSWVLGAHHVASVAEIALFFISGVSSGLLIAALIWLVYLAFEPYVRRIWPHALITWNRLLDGRLRDPVLGRDIVVGAAAGAVVAVLVIGSALLDLTVENASGQPAVILSFAFDGVRRALAGLVGIAPSAAITPIGLFFLLVFLKAMLRKTWLAVGLTLLLTSGLAANQDFSNFWSWLFAVAIWVLLLAVILRLGLLASVISFLVANVLTNLPYTTDLSSWYAGPLYLVLLVLAALVGWGVYVTLAGRELFAFDILADRPAG